MQFKQGATVSTYDGKNVGHVDRVVLNPKTKEVTHIVVRKGLLVSDRINLIYTDMPLSIQENVGKLSRYG